ncbi:MAG TPA: hypothetical protein VKQ52_16690, partial [Puia sp.]|nr:hypothetical protein [Puia sp.]
MKNKIWDFLRFLGSHPMLMVFAALIVYGMCTLAGTGLRRVMLNGLPSSGVFRVPPEERLRAPQSGGAVAQPEGGSRVSRVADDSGGRQAIIPAGRDLAAIRAFEHWMDSLRADPVGRQ